MKKLNLLKRKLYIKFDKSDYKNVNEYIENNKNNDDALNYKKIEKKINLIKHNMNKRAKRVDESRGNIDCEKLENDKKRFKK